VPRRRHVPRQDRDLRRAAQSERGPLGHVGDSDARGPATHVRVKAGEPSSRLLGRVRAAKLQLVATGGWPIITIAIET
jgi:hypothetical protein